jgi:hypothetical protein
MDREESAYAEGGEGGGGDAGEALAVGLEEGVVLPLLGLAEEPDLQLGALRRGLLADHLPPQQHGERHRRRAAPRGHRHRLGPRRHAPPLPATATATAESAPVLAWSDAVVVMVVVPLFLGGRRRRGRMVVVEV